MSHQAIQNVIIHHHSSRSPSLNAFTLIELLVVISIISVLATVVGVCLAGGIRVWDAARDFTTVEADALIDVEIMQRDLMNAIHFRDIGFSGNNRKISFSALLDGDELNQFVMGDEQDTSVARIGTISYAFDSVKSALFRKTWGYPFDESSVDGDGRKTISFLRDVNFQFYQPATDNASQGAWVSSWANTTNYPAMVKIALMFSKGLQPEIITKTIVLPIRGD